ncbi:GNAT family N-acetyltransferase [uncultured Rhodospira sp.]|uniref:GNAT family N-acetyltransferase n=1 Tax=uncultured Rhodospira sp. TaxID=1936189 RepID=UPI002639D113|nr:GNAT family N-acetyltransferase [uncultured Rhodospira sp.]
MTPRPLEIVPVAPAHVPVLAELHRVCFIDQPWHRPWDEAEMADVLTLPGLRGWVALAGPEGEPVGMLLVQIAGDTADIVTLAVRPAPWRRQGIGRALLGHAERDIRSLGATRLVLEVADGNAAGTCFYRSCGYQLLNRRRLYYTHGTDLPRDALVMARDLSEAPAEPRGQ